MTPASGGIESSLHRRRRADGSRGAGLLVRPGLLRAALPLIALCAWTGTSRPSAARAQPATTGPATGSCPGPTRDAALWHAVRYPRMEAADLYKLAHQGAAGPGHAIESVEEARAWLEREWTEIGDPAPGEPLFEPLPGAEAVVRVNLRAWKRTGGTGREVLDAFLDAARAIEPETAELTRRLDASGACLRELAEAGLLPVSGTEIRRYFERLRRKGYPAVHHSEAYRGAYAPAYRVVIAGALEPS